MRYSTVAVACAVLMGTSLLVVTDSAEGATSTPYKQTYIRRSGSNQMVYLVAPIPTTNWWYGNGENCGNASHKTANGGRFFSHGHVVAYSFPAAAVDDSMNSIPAVTQAEIRDFWEWNAGGQYFSYSHSGSESVQYNCWGYALGYSDIWIQDPSYIYADDYQSSGPEVGAVIPLSGHVIKITDICENGEIYDTVAETAEKNRASRIQTLRYYCPGGTSAASYLKKK